MACGCHSLEATWHSSEYGIRHWVPGQTLPSSNLFPSPGTRVQGKVNDLWDPGSLILKTEGLLPLGLRDGSSPLGILQFIFTKAYCLRPQPNLWLLLLSILVLLV